MNEITTMRPLRTIPEIRDDIQTHKQRAAQNLVELGNDLTDAKAQLQHGEWLAFLDTVHFSPRSAQNYMRLAEAAQTRPKLGEFPYSKALALIEAPEAVQDQLMEEGVEDKSAAEIRRLTKALKEEHQAREKAEEDAKQADQIAKNQVYAAKLETKAKTELQRQLDELLSHPQTVEVPPADYEELKARLQEAEQAAAEAEERAEAAMMAEPAPEDTGEFLRIQDALEAANAFAIKCWCIPYMGARFAAMDEQERNSYRILFQAAHTLCVRALETINQSSCIIEGAV